MKKFLLSFVCLLTMALPSLAETKTYQLVTDPEEILNPENQFIMVTATPLGGGVYAAKKTTTATINAVKILDADSCPNEITVDVKTAELGLFSIEENGDYYALYENVAPRYWGAGTSSTNMAVSTSLPTSNQYQISLTIEENAVKMIAQKTTTRYFAFQLNKAGTTCVVKNYAESNLNDGSDSNGNTYSFPLLYKEVDESLSTVQKVEIDYQVVGVEGIVSLTCPTEGAKIFYGFSEDSMDKEYTAPFTVTENCTVYAYAEKDGEKSNVSSYYIDLPYTSFKKVIENSSLTDAVSIIGDFEVIYQNEDNGRLILTDGTSNLLIFRQNNGYSIDYPLGTKISKIDGVVANYNNCFRLIDAELNEGGNGAIYAPVELSSFESLSYDNNIFDEVLIKNCNISGKDLGKAVIELGEENIPLYDLFAIGYENVVDCEITGFVWRNKDGLCIVPISIEGGIVTGTVETPIITPAQRELKPGDKVSISCATKDVNIYYTLDDAEPTEESTLYEGPFDFSGDQVTVKARAFYVGNDENLKMFPSAIASRTYHVWDPTCNVISVGNHDVDEKNSLNSYVKHTCTVDGVDYSMMAAHTGEGGQGGNAGTQYSLMMNNGNKTAGYFCYIIQASENDGYVLNGIELGYNQSDSKITFEVRGANTPFDDSASEGSERKEAITGHGTKIGVISVSSPSLTFEKDYKYFALYPVQTSGAVYLDNITIYYREPAPQAPAMIGLEDATVEGDAENGFLVEADHVLNISFDLDPEASNVQVEYIMATDEDEDDVEPQLYAGKPILIDKDCIFSYYAIDTITGSRSEEVNYMFFITLPEPPAVPTLKAEGAEIEGEYINCKDNLTINFEALEGIDVYYSLGTDDDAPKKAHGDAGEHDGFRKHNGEDIELTGSHKTLSFYACDPATGLHSDTATYTLNIATGVAEIDAEDADAIYFNLQGVQISKPENGVYIRVKKGQTEKIVK